MPESLSESVAGSRGKTQLCTGQFRPLSYPTRREGVVPFSALYPLSPQGPLESTRKPSCIRFDLANGVVVAN
jgi:hypothetical protein